MPLTKVASSMLASGTSGSGGSSGKNYISSYNGNSCNGDFESGSISGWNVCSVTGFTNGVPNSAATVISSPGVSDPALSLLSTGQLAGQFSLQAVFPTSAVNEGFISDIFTIDAQDQAKVLTFQFYYNLSSLSGTVNFSGTSSNAFLVAIYDQTNLAWIQPAGLYSMTQSSGTGIATGTFQTTSNSTQYRFAIFCASVTGWTGDATLKFDDFSVGPQTSPIGAVATDWVNFTPTGSWVANTTYTGKYRRVGDTLEVQTAISLTGAPTAANLTVNLPSAFVSDSSKTTSVGLTDSMVSGQVLKGLTGYAITGYLNTTTSIALLYISNGTNSAESPVASTAPVTFANGDAISISYRVPIQGWSSNVQTSNDTDTRVVACRVGPSSSISIASGSTTAQYTGITTVFDTHGAFSGGTTYTVPVSGIYRISGRASFNATVSANQSQAVLRVYSGATLIGTIAHRDVLAAEAGGITSYIAGSNTFSFSAGEALTFRGFQDSGVTRSSCQLVELSIERLSGPSVIAATETVGASYYASSNTSTAAGSAINFAGKDYDTHNAVTIGASWRFTAPISGTYSVKTLINTSTNPSTANYMNLHKNGSLYASIAWGNISDAYSGTLNLQLLAGEYIFLTPSTSTMIIAGNASRSSTSGIAAIQIQRVGN